VQMHPQDMARRQFKDGDLVHVTSKRGSIVLPIAGSTDLALSQVFIAMHWGPEYLGGRSSTGGRLAGVNALTTPSFCPDSKQPELKHAVVKVLKAELPWTLLAAGWLPAEEFLATRETLRRLMSEFEFASCVPFGAGGALEGGASERTGLLFRAAAHEPPPAALMAQIERLFALDHGETLRYADARHGKRRAVRVAREGVDAHVSGFLLAGDTRAESWIRALLQDQLPAQAFGRQLLSPAATAPAGIVARGKIVCSCFGITETAIGEQLAAVAGDETERLAGLQGALKCGTNCGSCLPELKRMVRAAPTPELAPRVRRQATPSPACGRGPG